MQGYYKRVYVDVECIINAHGKLRPLAFYWKEKRFEIIDFSFKVYGENQTGNNCNLYIISVDGNRKNLYFSEGAFFVEVLI